MSQGQETSWLDSAGVKALDTIWRIGADKAAEDLTIMAGEDFFLTEVKFRRVPLAELSMLLGPPDSLIASVLLEIRGDCSGDVLLLLPRESTDELVRILFAGCDMSPDETAANRDGALREAGNILGSAFLNAVAQQTGLEVVPTVPSHAEDMVAAVLDIVQIKHAARGDYLFVAKTGLIRGSTPLDLFLLAIFEEPSLATIIEKFQELNDVPLGED